MIAPNGEGVPMRRAPAAGRRSVPVPIERGPEPGRKQMALVGAAYHIEPHVRTPEQVLEALFQEPGSGVPPPSPRPAPQYKRLRAALSEADSGQPGHSADVIFPWLLEQAQGRDPQHQQPWVVVMDGQPTLWEPLDAVLKDTPRVEILDLLHANGYLWEAVHLFHAPGSDQALALMKLCLLALLKGMAQTLMSWLTDQAQRCGLSGAQRQRLAKISDYFHRHRHRVQYDQYLAARLSHRFGA